MMIITPAERDIEYTISNVESGSSPNRPMDIKTTTKPLLISKKGPYRPYIPCTAYIEFPGKTTFRALERLPLYLSILIYAVLASGHDRCMWLYPGKFSEKELSVLAALSHYKHGTFYIGNSSPIVLLVLKTLELDPNQLRASSFLAGSCSLYFLYKGLRRSGVNILVSFLSAYAVVLLEPFQKELFRISIEMYQLFFISIAIYSWRCFKGERPFRLAWWLRLAAVCLSCTLCITNKISGVATWLWICIAASTQMFFILGDLDLRLRDVWLHLLSRMLIVIVPILLLIASYHLHFTVIKQMSHHGTYVSGNFKANLIDGLSVQPEEVYYGSTVVIRHFTSLGGYLHSHNLTYMTGSLQQQVTIANQTSEDDFWVIEPEHNENFDYSAFTAVKNGDLLRFRHMQTGRLLRASAAKPPISDQENKMEVAATGEREYLGLSDELWHLNIPDAPPGEKLKPLVDEFQLTNIGQQCTLLSHDVRLPDWGFNQQEVICLESPVFKYTRFYIESSSKMLDDQAMTLPRLGVFSKMLEYLQLQYSISVWAGNRNIEEINKKTKELYQLLLLNLTGNTLSDCVVIACLVALFAYLFQTFFNLFSWQTWDDSATANHYTPSSFLYRENCFEWTSGWLIHGVAFILSRNILLYHAQCLPFLVFGSLLAGTMLQALLELAISYST